MIGEVTPALSLSAEVWLYILSYLTVPDLVECLLVCHYIRDILKDNGSIWKTSRQSPLLPLAIPDPPGNMAEWRYGVFLYGYRMCNYCKNLTNAVPRSIVNRIVLCDKTGCLTHFCNKMVLPDLGALTGGRVKTFVPVEGSIFSDKKLGPGLRYLQTHMEGNKIPLALTGLQIDDARKSSLAYEAWYLRAREARTVTLKHVETDFKNFCKASGFKNKFSSKVPRVASFLSYLDVTSQRLDRPEFKPILTVLRAEIESYLTELKLTGAMRTYEGDREVPSLCCVHCTVKGAKAEVMTLQNVRNHLNHAHQITRCRTSDIAKVHKVENNVEATTTAKVYT